MEVIRCEVKKTDHNRFTHRVTTVINLNIVHTKAYKTNTYFTGILTTLAGNSPEIQHSLEGKGFVPRVCRKRSDSFICCQWISVKICSRIPGAGATCLIVMYGVGIPLTP